MKEENIEKKNTRVKRKYGSMKGVPLFLFFNAPLEFSLL
jgi:hypothetical protein